MKCCVSRIIFVFLVTGALAFTANGKSEEGRLKDICQKKPLSSNCLIKKSEKPFHLFDSLSFLLKGKKKKTQGKGVSTGKSISSNSVSHRNNHEHLSALSTVERPNHKRVLKNIKNLENDACGIALEPRIFGGENTLPGEFPWLARLQYKERGSSKKIYACGGSLISPKYILTAAHCLKKHGLKLQSVRLGEYNTRMESMKCPENGITTKDFMEMDTCEPPRDYDVESHLFYEAFKPGGDYAHDIGLVLLRKSVSYTRYIMPVCLPIGRFRPSGNYGSELMSAGWGMTEISEGSPIPRKVKTPLMKMEACRNLLGKDLWPGQLCAGGAGGGSACRGDSGGPLFVNFQFSENEISGDYFVSDGYNKTILVGIISGGGNVCANMPILFTNVEVYMWWILTNIKT